MAENAAGGKATQGVINVVAIAVVAAAVAAAVQWSVVAHTFTQIFTVEKK